MQDGCVVVADNVLSFGQPKSDYLEHVRNQDIYSSSILHKSFVEYSVMQLKDGEEDMLEILPCDDGIDLVDGVEISIFKGWV